MIGDYIVNFKELDSTNRYVKDNYSHLKCGTVVTAKKQTSGYGRLDRNWYDDTNNLTISILLTNFKTRHMHLLSQLTGVAIIETLNHFDINAMIKWPNDILINNKKVSGILVETILNEESATVIIGIGLNVNTKSFPDELKQKATSLKLETNKEYNIDQLLSRLIDHMNILVKQLLKGNLSFLQICRNRNALLNKTVHLDTLNKEGIVRGIDENGRLLVEIEHKIMSFYGNEITLANFY